MSGISGVDGEALLGGHANGRSMADSRLSLVDRLQRLHGR